MNTSPSIDFAAEARENTIAEFVVRSELDQKLGFVEMCRYLDSRRVDQEPTVSFDLPDWGYTTPEEHRTNFRIAIARLDEVLAAMAACVAEGRKCGMLPEEDAADAQS